jgi:DUF4097 and DUF4098 domain-containing protein YvlB
MMRSSLQRGFLLGSKRARSGLLLLPLAACLAAASARLPAQTRSYRDGNFDVREITGVVGISRADAIVADIGIGNVKLMPAGGDELRYQFRIRSEEATPGAVPLALWPVNVTETRRFGRQDQLELRAPAPPDSLQSRANLEVTLYVPPVRNLRIRLGVGTLELTGERADIEIVNGAGRIVADDLSGRLRITTDSGDVELKQLRGDAEIFSGGGTTDVGSVSGRLIVRSNGGMIHVHQGGAASLLQTAAGGITVDAASGFVSAVTGGGNIILGKIAGSAHIHTGAGNIRVLSVHSVLCETRGGNIELRRVDGSVQASTGLGSVFAAITARASGFGGSLLQSMRGDVTVLLPRALPVTVVAQVRSGAGHVNSDFAALRSPSETNGVLTAQGKLNGGGPVLRLASSSSDISIRREPQ